MIYLPFISAISQNFNISWIVPKYLNSGVTRFSIMINDWLYRYIEISVFHVSTFSLTKALYVYYELWLYRTYFRSHVMFIITGVFSINYCLLQCLSALNIYDINIRFNPYPAGTESNQPLSPVSWCQASLPIRAVLTRLYTLV